MSNWSVLFFLSRQFKFSSNHFILIYKCHNHSIIASKLRRKTISNLVMTMASTTVRTKSMPKRKIFNLMAKMVNLISLKKELIGSWKFLTSSWKLTKFYKYIYHQKQDKKHCDIVEWTDEGNCFIVKNKDKFSNEILPKYFKHNKFSSFVRQLNMYDFHKIRKEKEIPIFKHK